MAAPSLTLFPWTWTFLHLESAVFSLAALGLSLGIANAYDSPRGFAILLQSELAISRLTQCVLIPMAGF